MTIAFRSDMTDRLKEEMDHEANYFAVCLLMPESFIRADIKQMGGVDLCNDLEVSALAKKYKVSISMMAARIGELFLRDGITG